MLKVNLLIISGTIRGLPEYSSITLKNSSQTVRQVTFKLDFDHSSSGSSQSKISSTIQVVAWGKLVETIESLLVGQEICVSGTLKALSEDSLETINKGSNFNKSDSHPTLSAKTITVD